MLDTALKILKPTTPEEVRALVAEAGAKARHIEVIGGGTKRGIGGMDPVDLVLSTQRLDRIVDYAPDELVLTVQPGVRLADIEALVAARGQMLAFEPPRWTRLLGARGEPTLGGVLAANLSGPRRIRAGAARDHFLGFEAVSGRGEVFKAGGKVVKNVTGYDLMKLMAGSWGTLAILTEVTIKVVPAPRTETTLMLFGLPDVRAAEAMGLAMNGPFEVSAAAHLPAFAAHARPLKAEMAVTALRLEGFEASVAARVDALALALKGYGRIDAVDRDHSRDFWSQVREVEAFAGDPRPLWRLSLPPAVGWRGPHGLPGDAIYDWAGGLAWLLTDEPEEKVRAVTRDLGGHALCLRGAPAFGGREGPLGALQDRVKAAFDPLGVLNPGRMDGGA
ncbi:MAG: glycolate oxidase subunit GlcE [Alphaproteobacteria bacterium]|nr:glycolate oxidase subunit GlcE [Alphaproteobacteria bacterium]MBU1515058.1 glycolate oxidase subunit GlcE [Alphaproteobacteria bacterium]MBU2094983.1 glycolate oxidase subunit GlcE [Alphaproteobacteria bacterium]MBU2149769.1 glycolate oxidase subunit GlcE [Alphaproteobacteria bacterium]MBU2307647.1 glycolate oxidase subunit GlcE [Alphaproteobacteria bacterium]